MTWGTKRCEQEMKTDSRFQGWWIDKISIHLLSQGVEYRSNYLKDIPVWCSGYNVNVSVDEFRPPTAPKFIQKWLWVRLASPISIQKSSSGFQPKWPNFYLDSAMGFQKISRTSIWIWIWVPRVLSEVLVLYSRSSHNIT